MAKKSFRKLNELQKHINKVIPSQIMADRKVETMLKGAMNQAIYDVVYSAYLPKVYERRRTKDGLGDTDVMQITEAIMDGNCFKIIFENLAKGNDTLKDSELASTIINGIEENWQKTGVWSQPRDFINEMQSLIQINPKPIVDAVKDSFKKCGFKVK